jgi:hypothetical protein
MVHALAAAEMLDAWERGRGRDTGDQAVLVLAAATGFPGHDLAALSINDRDRLLFELRRLTFGDELRAVVTCPECGERLEFTASISAMAPAGSPGEELPAPETFVVHHRGIEARVRPPTTDDLRAARAGDGVAGSRSLLLERCIQLRDADGGPLAHELLDEVDWDEIARLASEHTSLADVELDVGCAACGAEWRSTFDIAAFLWEEVAAFAARLLPEVHVLARAYGWSEREILGLSAGRRARYIELIEAGT